jgi:hypothetical protein
MKNVRDPGRGTTCFQSEINVFSFVDSQIYLTQELDKPRNDETMGLLLSVPSLQSIRVTDCPYSRYITFVDALEVMVSKFLIYLI